MTSQWHVGHPYPGTSDDFGDVSAPWVPTDAEIAAALYGHICPAGQPHTGDDPTQDHGHTKCMWIGLAIQRLQARATPPTTDVVSLRLLRAYDAVCEHMDKVRNENLDAAWVARDEGANAVAVQCNRFALDVMRAREIVGRLRDAVSDTNRQATATTGDDQ
jgi:hypothetical protein